MKFSTIVFVVLIVAGVGLLEARNRMVGCSSCNINSADCVGANCVIDCDECEQADEQLPENTASAETAVQTKKQPAK